MQKTLYSDHYQLLLAMLREMRNASGLTQSQLAHQLSISQSDVSKTEQGLRRLDVVELRQWLQALGGNLADFVQEFEARLQAALKPHRLR